MYYYFIILRFQAFQIIISISFADMKARRTWDCSLQAKQWRLLKSKGSQEDDKGCKSLVFTELIFLLYPYRYISESTKYLPLPLILTTLIRKLFEKIDYLLKESRIRKGAGLIYWRANLFFLYNIFRTATILAADLILLPSYLRLNKSIWMTKFQSLHLSAISAISAWPFRPL